MHLLIGLRDEDLCLSQKILVSSEEERDHGSSTHSVEMLIYYTS